MQIPHVPKFGGIVDLPYLSHAVKHILPQATVVHFDYSCQPAVPLQAMAVDADAESVVFDAIEA